MSQYAASRIFESYCQQFQGQVTGSMHAEFLEQGMEWWSYKVEIQGAIVLRYAKGAQGDVIPLTGELYGNAKSFRSRDNAIAVLHAGPAAGTTYVPIYRREPLGLSDLGFLEGVRNLRMRNLAQLSCPASTHCRQPLRKNGGLIEQNAGTPAFFRIPIRGELRGGVVRIEPQEATTDFEGSATKVGTIVASPLTAGMPQLAEYELPYKGARFVAFRAMNDEPAELPVRGDRTAMTLDGSFRRVQEGPPRGTYELSIHACP